MIKLYATLLFLLLANIVTAQNNVWTPIVREQTTIENITYSFHANVPIKEREADIALCQTSIKENLKLLHQNAYNSIIDIDFLFQDREQNRQIGTLGYAPGFVSACYYYPKTKMN